MAHYAMFLCVSLWWTVCALAIRAVPCTKVPVFGSTTRILASSGLWVVAGWSRLELRSALPGLRYVRQSRPCPPRRKACQGKRRHGDCAVPTEQWLLLAFGLLCKEPFLKCASFGKFCRNESPWGQQATSQSVTVARQGFSPRQVQRPIYEPGAQGPARTSNSSPGHKAQATPLATNQTPPSRHQGASANGKKGRTERGRKLGTLPQETGKKQDDQSGLQRCVSCADTRSAGGRTEARGSWQ